MVKTTTRRAFCGRRTVFVAILVTCAVYFELFSWGGDGEGDLLEPLRATMLHDHGVPGAWQTVANDSLLYSAWALRRPLAPWKESKLVDTPVFLCGAIKELERAKVYVGGKPVTIRATKNPAHAVLFVSEQYAMDENLFHQLVMRSQSFWCSVGSAVASGTNFTIASSTDTREIPFLEQFLTAVSPVAIETTGGTYGQIYTTAFEKLALSYSFELRPQTMPDPKLIALMAMVRRMIVPRLAKANRIVIVQRRGNRMLLDARTGTFKGLVDALRKRGLPVVPVLFDGLSAAAQITAVSSSHMFISGHGAQQTHIMWLPPKAIVVEVTMRFGWCCDPLPLKSVTGADPPPCTGPCRKYHKADYPNLARRLGLEFDEYANVTYVSPPRDPNPIVNRNVYVDAAPFALYIERLYNGWVQKNL